MFRWLPLGLVLAATGCAGKRAPPRTASSDLLPNAAKPAEAAVTRKGATLGYSGHLTKEGLERLKLLHDDAVRTLMVRSGGGEIGIGIAFGEWVHAHGLDVVVVDYCLSSCANYVFPAGKTKTILPGGVVAWHGDAHQRSTDEELVAFVASRGLSAEESARFVAKHRMLIIRLRVRENEFFERIGVSECLCRIGIERLGSRGLYALSIADMQRFGVKDVIAGPRHEADIDEEVRDRVGVTFLTVPAELDARSACE